MLRLSTAADSLTASLAAARARLIDPPRRDTTLAVLAAAALCAVCALALAGAVVLGPPGGARATMLAGAPPGR